MSTGENFSDDDSGLSPVVGGALLIAIVVTMMSVVGLVVLEGSAIEVTRDIEVVFDEDRTNGEIELIVRNGEGELDLRAGEDRPCDWDGPEEVERGYKETLEGCHSDLDRDDTISVVAGGSTLVDQYEFQGPRSDVFELEIDDVDAPAVPTEGETVEITTTVTNVGDEEGGQVIELVHDGDVITDENVDNLDAGESQELDPLVWDNFEDVEPPEDVTLTIESEDDSESTQISFNDPSQPIFEVQMVDYESSVTEGEIAEFEAKVENVGGESGTQDIALEINPDQGGWSAVDTQEVTLRSDQTDTVELEWEADSSSDWSGNENSRNYPARVSSVDHHSESNPVDILRPAGFTSIGATVAEGEAPGNSPAPLEVDLEWEMTESPPANTMIEIDLVNGDASGSVSVEEGSGTSTESIDAGPQDSPPAELTATIEGEIVCGPVEVDLGDDSVEIC